LVRPASFRPTFAGKPLPFASSYRLITTRFLTVFFLQRTFTSLVYAHAGRTKKIKPTAKDAAAYLKRYAIQFIEDIKMSNEGYHEPINELTDETRDMHRAITSLMEELEAVDWYNQRVDACKDEELKAILTHNRDEEKEHAAMVLEWIRRQDPSFDKELKDYLFTDKPIAHK